MPKKFLNLFIVAMGLLLSVAASAATTYTYVGNPFTSVDCSPNNNNCGRSVSGWFTVANPFVPNLSWYSFTPAQFSFTDGSGAFSLTSSQSLAVQQFVVSTDNTGAISDWGVVLRLNNTAPCDHTEEVGSWNSSTPGDWGCYFFNDNAWSGGNNHDSPGVWTETTSATPEPSSVLMLGSGVLGLAGVARRKLKLSLTTKLARSLGAIGAVAVLLFVGSGSAAASPSIAVTPYSPGNGVFYYDLAVPDATGATFNNGDVIIFSGMSGVTSAAAVEEVWSDFGRANAPSVTPTQVIFTADAAPFFPSDTFPFDQGAPYSYFEIDSPFSAVGTINWSIQTAAGTFSGTILGPVAPTTEPSSMLLLGSGILGLAGVVRRKLSL